MSTCDGGACICDDVAEGDEIGELNVIVEGKVNIYMPSGGDDDGHSGGGPGGGDVEHGSEASDATGGAVMVSRQHKQLGADGSARAGNLMKSMTKGDLFGGQHNHAGAGGSSRAGNLMKSMTKGDLFGGQHKHLGSPRVGKLLKSMKKGDSFGEEALLEVRRSTGLLKYWWYIVVEGGNSFAPHHF